VRFGPSIRANKRVIYSIMVNRNLIRSLEDDSVSQQVIDMPSDEELGGMIWPESDSQEISYELNNIIDGTILRVNDDAVLIDVGFKSEGTIPRNEWDPHEPVPKVGDVIKVLIEDVEDETGSADDPHGLISLSKRKADTILHWEGIIKNVEENDIVTGTCTRKIKGGLLVDIGVRSTLYTPPSSMKTSLS